MRTFSRKPLSWAKTEGNLRVHPGDEAEVIRLGHSYKKRPVHPLIARPDGTMIDGSRRVIALRLIGETEAEFLITDEDLKPEDLLEIGLITAIHRLDLTGFEKWRASEKLLSLHPGWLGKDLAEYLHFDASMVTRLLSPGKCIAEAQEALGQGKIGISDCYALSKAPAEEQKRLLALKLSGASRDQLESEGRKRRNASGQPARANVRTSRVKCELGANVSVIIAGNALGLDEVIEALGAARKEARKARDQNLDVKTWSAVMRDRAKNGG
jgi:ParB family transcriptional regulator, chromosome partitioning protein